MPGFIDTHTHAPQFTNCGLGQDLELLDWLTTYTFPTEAQFKDKELAQKIYERVVYRTLRNGTTTSCYYGTIHWKSTLKLAEVCEQFGQRAFVGKVNMDSNSSVELTETTAQSVSDTVKFIEAVQH